MSLRNRELWSVVLWLEKRHGERAGELIDVYLNATADREDETGYRIWQSVGERLKALSFAPLHS